MNFVNDLINFLRNSPKRLAELASFTKVAGLNVSIRPLCPTRWTLRYSSLDSLKTLAAVILEELEYISSENTERDVRAKAFGLIKFMSSFEFCMMLEISLELFCVTDRLSKIMQKETISAMEGKKVTELVLSTIDGWRNENHYNDLWNKTEVMHKNISADEPTMPRQRKRTSQYDTGIHS